MAHLIRFDSFEVDLRAGRLHKHGLRINLRDKSFQVLSSLLEHPGEVVTRDELRHRLWQDDVFVDFDNNLNAAIARLREALGDSADHPHFIETLPKHGYRFIAPVLPPSAEAVPSARVRLLVLPFANLSGDPAQEYFSDAMTDEIITALAGLAPDHMAVIARTTAMRYKGSQKGLDQISRELQVGYIVEGGVRRAAEHLCINVQLVTAADQTNLFAQRYHAGIRDMFDLHSRIAHDITRHTPAIADAIRAGFALPEPFRRKPTEDLAAYNEYIKGRYHMWKMTAAGLAEAKRHFEAALVRDPQFALACNALAELCWYLGICGFARSNDVDRLGRSYALRALALDSSSAETHALLSFFPGSRDGGDEIDYWNWDEMQREAVLARQLDPRSRLVQLRYAMVRTLLGYPEEGAAELQRALESDPLSIDLGTWLVVMFNHARQHQRALEYARRLSELEPEHFLGPYLLGKVYLAMRKFDESAAAFRKAIEFGGDLPVALGFLGLALGFGGHTHEAQAVLDRLHELACQGYAPPMCFAWVHLGLGHMDEAFMWLERAINAPDHMIEALKTFPFLGPLRADPRFPALLRKMNLEP